ncbi:MAG: hypothetical protein FGM15_07540 [Chthoniobacterales bacterium]|nr:hypothetical protein [Chthoniobacterales bacterium]
MDLLITILAYILALIASAVANVIGFWLFLPLTYFAAKAQDGATELRLRILRQFLGSVAAFPLALAAACVVLSLFGICYGWLIFVLVAAHILSDVFSAKVFPLSQQAGAAISIIVTGAVYFAYFLNG